MSSFKQFEFFVLPNNTDGSTSIPLLFNIPTILATVNIDANKNNVVSLIGHTGWQATGGLSSAQNVLFKIWRGNPSTGTLIYSALESSESGFDNFKVSTLVHVDSITQSNLVTYSFTAELVNAGDSANVIGPITFTATTIEQ